MNYLTSIIYLFTMNVVPIFCTIDVNLSEFEYLAAHLNPSECRRLVAALHFNSYELPESLEEAERKLDENIPCLRQLLHWNMSPNEGKGKTHSAIEHRLRQLDRNDLADWLGKETFKQLGNDLEKAVVHPFGLLGEPETETSYPITLEPIEEADEEDRVDTLLEALFVGSLASLLVLIGSIIVHKVRQYIHLKRENTQQSKEETLEKAEEAKHLKNTVEEGELTESETDDDSKALRKQ